MNALASTFGISVSEAGLLLFFTYAAVLTEQVHSWRGALAEVRAARGSITWRAIGSVIFRQEKRYWSKVPMLVAFVLAAVIIVVGV